MKFNSLKIGVLLVAITLFFSCSKTREDNHFLKLNVNGTWVTWKKTEVYITPDPANPQTRTSFYLRATDDTAKEVFIIMFDIKSNNFSIGSYAHDEVGNAMYVTYLKNAYSNNQETYMLYPAAGQPAPKFIITFTAISDTEIRGSFTCNYLTDIKDHLFGLPEGEFFLKRNR